MLKESAVASQSLLSVLRQKLSDYVTLTKPRVISLLLFTTLAAMFVTPAGLPSWQLVVWTAVAGYLMAGAANAFNMAYDSDIDLLMGRTSRRPIPSHRVSKREAIVFSALLLLASFAIFAWRVNVLSGVLALVGFVYYTVIYTAWLKRRTSQNIVIGGGAGAVPALIGYAAASNTLDWVAFWLFVIVFLWTPPHFWALALLQKTNYANANIPMLPVVAGEQATIRQIWIYSWIMVAASLVLVVFGAMSWIYGIAAVALGAQFMRDAAKIVAINPRSSLPLYKYSLLYLALLFLAMVLDRIIL
jgi:protoheme IX farnesyltransferase